MNKEEDEEYYWGTLEELLLACAVNRHGSDSWETVSAELRSRASDHRRHFTPPNCRRRYSDLRRRLGGDDDDVVAHLRKLRVEELRREVEKHDASIEFLRSKLKKLEDEREETDRSTEPEIKKPVDDSSDGRETETRSLNESNSTINLKDEPVVKPVEPDEIEPVRITIKRRGRGRFEIASSSGEDEVPLAAKQISIKSQPLIKILAMLRAHKNGSVFERRLPSQESERYSKMIRQHVDLQIIQRRLDKGFYLDSQCKFFRDLLLLFTNALVFFPKTSNEYLAACELQKLVNTQMLKTTPKPDPVKKQIVPVRDRKERAPSPTIVVCRRRCLAGSKPGSNSVAKSPKELEVKVKTKNPKLDVKTKQKVIVKKPNVKENNHKKTPPVKKLETSSSDETDDDDEAMVRCRNKKRGGAGRRDKGTQAESSKFVKKGRPVKSPPPVVAARGRGGKRGKESGVAAVVEDTGRTRKRPRR